MITSPGLEDRLAGLSDRPVYVISVAAELAGMHPQTLRTYDRLGLVTPGRAAGRGRRYSDRDVALLREVCRLSQGEGINLAGVRRILELEVQVAQLQAAADELAAQLAETRAAAAQQLTEAARATRRDLVPVRPGAASVVLWRRSRRPGY